MAEIRYFAGNFAPRGWAFCQGQMQAIANNTALFSLLGTNYGGDGVTTFALPDSRGRSAVGTGTGPGLTSIVLAEVGGTEQTTLNTTQLPAHTHSLAGQGRIAVNSATGDTSSPVNNVLAASSNNFNEIAGSSQNLAGGITGTTQTAGSSQPFNNREPYLGLNFIIALEGIFPSRN